MARWNRGNPLWSCRKCNQTFQTQRDAANCRHLMNDAKKVCEACKKQRLEMCPSCDGEGYKICRDCCEFSPMPCEIWDSVADSTNLEQNAEGISTISIEQLGVGVEFKFPQDWFKPPYTEFVLVSKEELSDGEWEIVFDPLVKKGVSNIEATIKSDTQFELLNTGSYGYESDEGDDYLPDYLKEDVESPFGIDDMVIPSDYEWSYLNDDFSVENILKLNKEGKNQFLNLTGIQRRALDKIKDNLYNWDNEPGFSDIFHKEFCKKYDISLSVLRTLEKKGLIKLSKDDYYFKKEGYIVYPKPLMYLVWISEQDYPDWFIPEAKEKGLWKAESFEATEWVGFCPECNKWRTKDMSVKIDSKINTTGWSIPDKLLGKRLCKKSQRFGKIRQSGDTFTGYGSRPFDDSYCGTPLTKVKSKYKTEGFEAETWLTKGKCAICNSPSKFTVMTAIGERSFCCEACYADYMGLPVEKEGYYGLEAETKKLPPVEKAEISGIASGATMEGLDLALGAEDWEYAQHFTYNFTKERIEDRAPLTDEDLQQMIEILQNVPVQSLQQGIDLAEENEDEPTMIVLVMALQTKKFREEWASEDEDDAETAEGTRTFKITDIRYDTYDEEADEQQTQEDLELPTEMTLSIDLEGDEEHHDIYDILTSQIENQGHGWLVESFSFDAIRKGAETFEDSWDAESNGDRQLEESIKRTKMSAVRTGLAITTFGIVLWNLWTNKKQEQQIDDIMNLV